MGLFGPSKKEQELQSEVERLRSMLPPEGVQIADWQNRLIEIEREKAKAQEALNAEQAKIRKAQDELRITEQKKIELQREIVDLQSDIGVQDYGLYRPTFKLATSDLYKDRLKAIREQQKQMIKNGKACTGNMQWTVNGDLRKGKKMVSDMQKLLLRAFNVECDDIVENVKISNIDKSWQRISKIADQISKLGAIMSIAITPQYMKLKQDEVSLALDFDQKKQEEKEKIREARAREREEARVQKEIEEERKRLQKEQTHYKNALAAIISQLDRDPSNPDLIAKRTELEANIRDTEKAIADVDYREANKRAGYVYIISNIGAFGENMYKIGMTRRLEPTERIDELSGASVPFNFDIHALIFTEDAPGLEAALHRAFESKKVNKINPRREFFRVSLDEIKREVRKNFDKTVEWIDFPEADQYRQSLLLGGKPIQQPAARHIAPPPSAVKDETAPAAQKPVLKSEPKKQISPIDALKAALGAYTTQDEDTPAFTRIHIYDSTNRKIGLVKITKPDMKMTFKVPGDPTLHELNEAEDIRKYL